MTRIARSIRCSCWFYRRHYYSIRFLRLNRWTLRTNSTWDKGKLNRIALYWPKRHIICNSGFAMGVEQYAAYLNAQRKRNVYRAHILHALNVMCDWYVVTGWIIHRLCVVIGIPLHKTAKSRIMCIKCQLHILRVLNVCLAGFRLSSFVQH